MGKEKLSGIITEYEKNILHYVLSDIKHLQYVFGERKIKTLYFKDPDIKLLLDIATDNFRQHQTKLVREELELHLDAKRTAKSIDKIEYQNLLGVFDEVTGPDYDLKDEQFTRVFKSWLEIEASPRVETIIQKNLHLVKENKGLEFVRVMNEAFEKDLVYPDKFASVISSLDIKRDSNRQVQDFEDRRDPEKRKELIGIPTGIPKLDKIFAGFETKGGSLTLVGGLVGHGKSTLMLNISRNQAMKPSIGKKILTVTLEMPDIQWVRKFNCIDLQMKYLDFLVGDRKSVSETQAEQFIQKIKNRSSSMPGEYKVLFIPAKAYSWDQIVNEIDKRFPGYNPDIIYIDQLSLIGFGKYSKERPDYALGLIVRDMRAYAQIRKIAIVLAVQANRASVIRSKNGEREIDINIENVEDSNKVGAHADNFIAIHQEGDEKIFIKIAKQREGAKKVISLKANQDMCLFYDEGDPDMICKLPEIEGDDSDDDSDETIFAEEIEEIGGVEKKKTLDDVLRNVNSKKNSKSNIKKVELDDVFDEDTNSLFELDNEEINNVLKEDVEENKTKTKDAIMDLL